MVADIDLVAALLAVEAGGAVRLASHRRVAVQPHALVMCPIGMAGEDTTIHIVAVGTVGAAARILSVPDPRIRDDQYRLFAALLDIVGPYFEECRASGDYPQIWVQSRAAATLLDTLAERLRFARSEIASEDDEQEVFPAARWLGQLLTYAADRFPIAGQQALLSATSVLRTHWITGQQPAEDEHLGSLLVWIKGAEDIYARIAQAELIPMGIRTDPLFDRDVLEPKVAAYGQARRSGASPARLSALARKIEEALEPVALRIYGRTQEAIRLLQGKDWPPFPFLDNPEDLERAAFQEFMNDRDAGRPLPIHDSAPVSVYKIEYRERAVETLEAAVRIGDNLARARGRESGHVLAAEVAGIRLLRDHEFEVQFATSQRVLRVRRRDRIHWIENLNLVFAVKEVQRAGNVTSIRTVVKAKGPAVELPVKGSIIELVANAPDWGGFERDRRKIARRIHPTPWPHDEGRRAPTPQPKPAPADPLALLERLR